MDETLMRRPMLTKVQKLLETTWANVWMLALRRPSVVVCPRGLREILRPWSRAHDVTLYAYIRILFTMEIKAIYDIVS